MGDLMKKHEMTEEDINPFTKDDIECALEKFNQEYLT